MPGAPLAHRCIGTMIGDGRLAQDAHATVAVTGSTLSDDDRRKRRSAAARRLQRRARNAASMDTPPLAGAILSVSD